MRILELDSGNTRLKWRIQENGLTLHQGFFLNAEDWQVCFTVLQSDVGSIDQARASVVSGSDRAELLGTIIGQCFDVQLQFLQVKSAWRGLCINYENPMMLGVDRWLAMLTAWNYPATGTKIIVDGGTALTIDIIDSNGHHLGGYIVPGQSLMKQSLQSNTAPLKLLNDYSESINPGVNTTECINQGVLAMSVALINETAGRFRGVTVFLTGGDAHLLKPFIKATSIYLPDMVMDGLVLGCRDS